MKSLNLQSSTKNVRYSMKPYMCQHNKSITKQTTFYSIFLTSLGTTRLSGPWNARLVLNPLRQIRSNEKDLILYLFFTVK